MNVNVIYVWNHLQGCHQDFILHLLSTNELKKVLKRYFFSKHTRYFLNSLFTCIFANCQFTQNNLGMMPVPNLSPVSALFYGYCPLSQTNFLIASP